jgi:hypothetical protein
LLDFSANLIPIAKPSTCTAVLPVLQSGVYEKSLCYTKTKATYNSAKIKCSKQGMQLYQVKSSDASSAAIFNLAKQALGGSSKTAVFVDGTQGKKCQTYRGDGALNFDWCTTARFFVCEFNDKGIF